MRATCPVEAPGAHSRQNPRLRYGAGMAISSMVIVWLLAWAVGIAICLLILWFIIYTAVRAALRSDRERVEREQHPSRYRQ